ncbi:MAG: hypothetical protein KBD31_01755 [Proteobacteria bacterium]|nr:hypothetical protein [Pseudomonadota bacterium]
MNFKLFFKLIACITAFNVMSLDLFATSSPSSVEKKENYGLISLNDLSLAMSYMDINVKEFVSLWLNGDMGQNFKGKTDGVDSNQDAYGIIDLADDIIINLVSKFGITRKNPDQFSRIQQKSEDFKNIKKIIVMERYELKEVITDPATGKVKFDFSDEGIKRLFDQICSAIDSYNNSKS